MPSEYDIYRILAQSRPNGTGNTTAYTKPTIANKLSTVYGIVVCNTTASAVTYRVFVCTNGSTYDQTTALVYDAPLAANESQMVELQFTLDTASGTIGVQSSTGNAINFTIIGKNKE